MAEGSGVGSLVLGGAVGFALFLIGSSLGFGGRGHDSGGRGVAPPTPPRPQRPRDEKSLSFVMVEPKEVGRPAGFRLVGDDPHKIYSIDELVARVRDGGRGDVVMRAAGDVIQRPWAEAQDRVKHAGITLAVEEKTAVSGFPARGHYRTWRLS